MRSQPVGFGRSSAQKPKSYLKLLTIIGFSGGLMFAYMFISGPQTERTARRSTIVDVTGGRKELHEASKLIVQTDMGSRTGGGTPTAPQITSVERPPPHVESIGIHDQRHVENVKQMLSQQSSHDEHKSSETQAMKEMRSDTSEKGSGASSTTSASSTSSISSASSSKTSTSTTGAASADGKASTSSEPKKAAEPVALSSGVASSVAALQHASEHLKESVAELAQTRRKKIQADAVVAVAATDKNAATPIAVNATKSRSAETIATTAAFDALAYSKAHNHPGDTIHTMFTSNGSPYQNFQARIMWGTYNVVRKMPGGEKMVAMTRVLHRTTPDEIMNEIPTFRADPLQPECDRWCWFPVADRANAVQQWLDAAAVDHTLIKAPWLLMLESDYVWIKPLAALGSAYDLSVPGLSFAFDYISPNHPVVKDILKMKCPDCDPANVPNSGPAPVLVRYSDMRAATPLWEELSLYIETHKEAKQALGWVREMYAWDIGVAANKLNILNQGPGPSTLISQPPHDSLVHNASMYHYTWGSIFKDSEGKEIWKFDKRFYTDIKDALKVPRIPLPPPWREGVKLHDGNIITKELHAILSDMITHMNLGIDTLPDLTPKATV